MCSRTMIILAAAGLSTTVALSPPAEAQSAAETQSDKSVVNRGTGPLEVVAEFPDRRVTGVTVTEESRIFVCFPLWDPDYYDGAVAEVTDNGELKPYPDKEWNAWRLNSDADPGEQFVCVQSVVADRQGSLWVLDPAAPMMQEVVKGGAKLVQIDLERNEVVRTYRFDEKVAPNGSYLNDVRIDHGNGYAYITDSGKGALVLVNLSTGNAKRVLEGHTSTTMSDVVPVIGNRPLRTKHGKVPNIHADGIALDPNEEYLYWHALVGYNTYRIATKDIARLHDRPDDLANKVEDLGPDVICDGMVIDADGDIYYTALEYDAIIRRVKGHLKPVLIDRRLQWPDTLSIGPEGDLYITVSKIHLRPTYNEGGEVRDKAFALYRLPYDLEQKDESGPTELSELEKAIDKARKKSGIDQ